MRAHKSKDGLDKRLNQHTAFEVDAGCLQGGSAFVGSVQKLLKQTGSDDTGCMKKRGLERHIITGNYGIPLKPE